MNEAISAAPILAGLSEWELRNLSALAERRMVPAGTVVAEQGGPGADLYILMSGHAAVRQASPGAGVRELAVLNGGEFFGEVALLTGGVRSASVVALTELDLLSLSRASLQRLQDNAPAIAARLLWNLSRLLCERMLSREAEGARESGGRDD